MTTVRTQVEMTVLPDRGGDPIPASRSALMARVGQKHTKPEMVVRKALHAAGLRFRLHRRDLPGSPDIVLPYRRSVIFVHGCFWHRHPGCRAASTPATRTEFWNDKFSANVARDRRSVEELERLGWSVRVVWECETRKDGFLAPLLAFLEDRSPPRKTRLAERLRLGG